ncbi:hypothetical protein QBC32DRAFT_13963 [Pseudoneurospora amorphoporcata]|uniref:Uncharacterized protein n=1 Tax=Pseudoneurospora amorphoporcata TaxID=241081 RepID=A0AAN6NQZ6_9PEZI|nr:hypothetical protein QBC32DRAFT_13963 [Pseudoneurospora amorphoporcata]
MGKKKNKSSTIAADFARYFGENKLENWQRLCRDIGIHQELPSITRCRKVLKSVHVNIFDLLDAVRQGTTPQRFQNSYLLAQYSVASNKIFPKRFAKDDGGPVKVLLRLFF